MKHKIIAYIVTFETRWGAVIRRKIYLPKRPIEDLNSYLKSKIRLNKGDFRILEKEPIWN